MKILEKLSFILLPILLSALFASIIPRKLKRRQQFNDAAKEFRKIFNKALVDTRSRKIGTITTSSINKIYHVAYLNFRPYLRGIGRCRYDEAWNEYCFDYKYNRYNNTTIEKNIETLLECTNRRKGLNNMFFLWIRLYHKLRPKVFDLDKKTKKTM